MTEATVSVDEWVTRIQKTRSARELLKMLEQFRKLDWTDVERQKISHTYMKVLDVILKTSAESIRVSDDAAPGNDGPVWYEKM